MSETTTARRTRGVTPMLLLSILASVMGMFQFGFNTGVVNAPQSLVEQWIGELYRARHAEPISDGLRRFIWSATVSVFAIGGMLGGVAAPAIAQRLGCKTGLLLNNAPALLGAALMCTCRASASFESLIAGRLLVGLSCGLNTALVPMHLSEIATLEMRGALGTVSQLGVTIGLLVSQLLGLGAALGTRELWPYLFGVALVPSIVQLALLPLCPESPRYLLLARGRLDEARAALRQLRGGGADVEADIEEMRAEERANQAEIDKYGKLDSLRELLHKPWLREPLIIGVVMQLSQQLSGINAIFYYSTSLFLSAQIAPDSAVYATIGVGVIMVLMTLVSIPLMDRLGRRPLHLSGLGGMFWASIVLTASFVLKSSFDAAKYVSVASVLVFVLFFAIGPGSIPFMITAELFTQGTRPLAMSVSVLMNWLSNFVVGLTFPLIESALNKFSFVPFTILLALFWLFTYKKLPETKNRTFEEIASVFKREPLNTSDGSGTQTMEATSSELRDYGSTRVERPDQQNNV